ncbi:AMP-binding protein [Nocardioides rubriscoriae]|uniref:AMP-binding protein n=1 Tax=Nocardioides rubriscoriae TaxID=642762 RepID=UPI0011DFBF97|nr:AMP-binding protein [Nocardioides rubriscoriae]
MNLAENLDRTARTRGRFAAVTLEDSATSFGEVDWWSRRVAGFLAARGVRTGDRVALVLPDVLEYAALYYGILRLGAVVVPLSPLLGERGLHHHLQDADVTAVVAWSGLRSSVESAAGSLGVVVWLLGPGGFPELLGDARALDLIEPRTSDDTAVIAFTAGTTGEPLGAALTHGNVVRNCEFVVNDLVQLTSDDVVLAGLPLTHAFMQTAGLNAAVRAGAGLVLLTRLDGASALRALRDHGVTVLAGGPQVFEALLREPQRHDLDASRLRVGLCEGAALRVDVLLGFEEAFHCLVLEGYGLAETSPLASFNRMDRRRVGSIGVAVNGVALRVVDEVGREVADGEPGEIVVRGHNVMQGYHGRADATAASIIDGWLRTGDVGVKDEDGFFYVVDRIDDLIVRDGRTIYSREVEDVLHEHPDVELAAVIGIPHPGLGAEVHAVVVLRSGASATPAELQAFVRERLAPHQYPREVHVVTEIPRSSNGKILKRAIRLESRA